MPCQSQTNSMPNSLVCDAKCSIYLAKVANQMPNANGFADRVRSTLLRSSLVCLCDRVSCLASPRQRGYKQYVGKLRGNISSKYVRSGLDLGRYVENDT